MAPPALLRIKSAMRCLKSAMLSCFWFGVFFRCFIAAIISQAAWECKYYFSKSFSGGMRCLHLASAASLLSLLRSGCCDDFLPPLLPILRRKSLTVSGVDVVDGIPIRFAFVFILSNSIAFHGYLFVSGSGCSSFVYTLPCCRTASGEPGAAARAISGAGVFLGRHRAVRHAPAGSSGVRVG